MRETNANKSEKRARGSSYLLLKKREDSASIREGDWTLRRIKRNDFIHFTM